jgi:arylsulfatase A-like enzyme
LRRALAACLFLAPAACLFFALGLGRADAKPVVILLSMDGVRHDFLARDELPAFERMAREGARAEALVPVFPSTTFPNHVSLATGTYPDRHGIVANKFVDAELGAFDYGNDARFLEAEPLWAAAERQGVPVATFFWVGSETDWRGVGARYRRAPFDSKIGEAEKVRQILAWLDLPEDERPGLVMSWWHGADHAGHRHGPDAEETRAALRAQDRELGSLLAGLDARDAWAETTLLVVSDHGMTRYERTVDVREVLREAGIGARVIHAVATAQVHLKKRTDRERALALLRALPDLEAWPRDEVPARLRYRHPRAGDLVALAAPPLALLPARDRGSRFGPLLRLFGGASGAHGYDPAHVAEMAGIFVAMGRGVAPRARLPRVRAIDVAATTAGLLGIEPPAGSEGEPIPGIRPTPLR